MLRINTIRMVLVTFGGVFGALYVGVCLHLRTPLAPAIAIAAIIGSLALGVANHYLRSKHDAREVAGMRSHIQRMQLSEDLRENY
jgi:hypothetical protein